MRSFPSVELCRAIRSVHNIVFASSLIAFPSQCIPCTCRLHRASLDLARNCLPRGCFRATATTIVLAQRRSNVFIEPAVAEMLEEECGRAVLTAIVAAK